MLWDIFDGIYDEEEKLQDLANTSAGQGHLDLQLVAKFLRLARWKLARKAFVDILAECCRYKISCIDLSDKNYNGTRKTTTSPQAIDKKVHTKITR